MKENDSLEVTKQMWSLANDPKLLVKEYLVWMVNGQKHDFYFHVCKIWELEYMYQYKVVLFNCEWYNTGNKSKENDMNCDT